MKNILMITALCAVIMTSVGCKNNENVGTDLDNPNTNIGENVDNGQEGNKEPEKPVEDNKEPEKPVEDNKEPEKPVEDNKEPEKPVEDNKEPEKPVEDNKEPEKPVEDNKEPEKPVEDDEDFEEPEEKSEAYLELEKLVNGFVEDSKLELPVPFNMEITSQSSVTYVGLKSEEFDKSVEVGVAYESMMMPSNHSFCLLKLKEGADLTTIKQNIFDNCNPRKWVCMTAEYVYVAGKDNYVMLVMSTKENCENLVKTFENKIGKDDNVLQKVGEEPWDGWEDTDVIF